MNSEAPSVGQKTWELTPYELNRQPQELITDDREIAVTPRCLHSELMCPICLDMLRNTMTTKECLHRFCHDCIITALRNGNKECPTCRKKLASKRGLRPDPNFDMLISKIHPNREEYEEQQNKLLDNLRYQTTGLSLEENLRMQALSRATHASKLKKMSSVDSLGPESPPASSQSEDALHPSVKKKVKRPSLVGSNQSFSHGIEADEAERDISSSVPQVETSEPEIEVIFVPLPHDGLKADFPTERRYIKTTTNATIEHLVKYLSIRHKLEGKKKGLDDPGDEVDESLFTLYLATGPGQYQPLHSSKTLDQIRQERFKSGPIHLHYAYKLQVCTTQVEPIPPGIL